MGTLKRSGGIEESLISQNQEFPYDDQESDIFSDFVGAGAGYSAGANPYLLAGMVGLKVLEAGKQREQRKREMAHQAKISQNNRQNSALMSLANLGSAVGLA